MTGKKFIVSELNFIWNLYVLLIMEGLNNFIFIVNYDIRINDLIEGNETLTAYDHV